MYHHNLLVLFQREFEKLVIMSESATQAPIAPTPPQTPSTTATTSLTTCITLMQQLQRDLSAVKKMDIILAIQGTEKRKVRRIFKKMENVNKAFLNLMNHITAQLEALDTTQIAMVKYFDDTIEAFKTARRLLRQLGHSGAGTVEQRVDNVVVRIKAMYGGRG
jgi:dihydroorotase